MPITALAPSCSACCSIRLKDSSLVLSQRSLRSVMFPPTSVCSPAPMVPNTDLERTIIPRTTPSVRETRYPSRSKEVEVMLWGITCGRSSLRKLGDRADQGCSGLLHQSINLFEHFLHPAPHLFPLFAQRHHFSADQFQFLFPLFKLVTKPVSITLRRCLSFARRFQKFNGFVDFFFQRGKILAGRSFICIFSFHCSHCW